MKTQLAKPARTKASYTDQYKQEALELWRSSGRSAAKVAAELGIRAPLLYRWAQLEREPKAAKSSPKAKRTLAELEAEIRRLRAENAKLLEQREVLKKSLGILSEDWSVCNGVAILLKDRDTRGILEREGKRGYRESSPGRD